MRHTGKLNDTGACLASMRLAPETLLELPGLFCRFPTLLLGLLEGHVEQLNHLVKINLC